MAVQQAEIQAALKSWRDGLVGLTRQSALIKFRASKTSSLLIDAPSPDEVFARLQSGKLQAFRGDVNLGDPTAPKPPAPGTFFHSPRPDGEVGPVVRNLMRRASAEFLDRGLLVLYVAFGMLDWHDVDESAMISPLLLVPVELHPEGPKGTPRVTKGEDDPVLNPALALRLREFGIDLPTTEDIEGLSVAETLAQIRSALEVNKTFNRWRIRETAYLSMFSFAKEAMFKDLLDNEEKILAHPVVRALATSDPSKQSADFQFEPIDATEIDRVAPPEVTPLVLDADSTQRAAVAAALAGSTFVMDGPPGTGKSQTIANMIGALLHSGKTVLFVSEKMAALDVVRNRLTAAGLGIYLLELHSHKASRREVATELLRTLDNVARPPAPMGSLGRQSARERREQLNGYAAAMNEVREPLRMSLHHVLGLLANLSGVPSAPVPESAFASLTEPQYGEVQETLSRLARAWRPASQGRSFLWREVVDEQSLEVRLYQAETALEELRGTVSVNAGLTDAFGLSKPSDTPQLLALLAHQHVSRPVRVVEQWLTDEQIQPLLSARVDLRTQIADLRAAEEDVTKAAGVPWTSLPDEEALPLLPDYASISRYQMDLRPASATDLRVTADRFEADALMLSQSLRSMSSLAVRLGLSPVSSFADVDRLSRLVDLQSQNTHPDRRWFTSTGLAEARQAATTLRERVLHLSYAESQAASMFTSEALTTPLADLQDRFTNLHRGLKKLSGNYRTDKRIVAGLLANAADVKQGISHLSDAIAWAAASKALDDAVATRAVALGTHWTGRTTNFEQTNAALNVVEEVLGLTGSDLPAALVSYMTGTETNGAIQSVIDTTRGEIAAWKRTLAPSPSLAGRPELVLGPIQSAIEWLTEHLEPMRRAAARIDLVDDATQSTHTLVQADYLLSLGVRAKRANTAILTSEAPFRAALGEYFNFAATDLDALDEAIVWTTGLRTLAQGPLTTSQVKALADSNDVAATSPAYQRWIHAKERVVDAFNVSRTRELSSEFDDYRDAVEFINALRDDTVGQQEWFEYQHARDALASHGLDTAVDFCLEQRVVEGDVAAVVKRALLRAWADATIQRDPRLRPFLAEDREALVEQYRSLDRDLIKSATSDIINVANTRRPVNTTMGESGVIRREGSKQKKHKPVRDLMSMTRNVTPCIKPVFMMSPLAVSQYLPPDMEFDVVIFDEASQVTPGDAINCIYRGKALILAGDDKQLPPTSFFERNTDDDDEEDTDVKDFQSVLELAKAAGAFNNLGLRWHYRSRHEDLIAFSNYKFYEGKLVTFPSAHAEGLDVGVEFFHTNGVYRRGGGAYNPIEAAKVADRVIEHFTSRPDKTLGVVTFSVAQADAVQDAIDEARLKRRDLDGFFDTEDRLDGFFIRALEQVQGDERDVIIFSIGYGPDEAGKVSTNFGALNKDKGWRRLNVGITRARQRVEVVASMRAGQIPPSTNENVEYFRAYLDYADKGSQVLAIPYSSTGLDPESPFEESVIASLRGWGYIIEPQVGAAGYRIDIGVRHPAYPGMFAIGIECDGYQYHSAPAARDRDRLRDQILVGLGWRLHRIWGTAWYRDRAIEESRLRKAVEEAFAAPLGDRNKMTPASERVVVETDPADAYTAPTWASDYILARETPLPRWVDPGESGNHLHMVDAIQTLVAAEGPVHLDLVYERLRGWWNVGRIGSNIRSNIDLAISRADVARDGNFLLLPGSPVTQVRVPVGKLSRKVEHVHVEELAMAAALIVRDVGAVGRAEVVQGIARIFGWARTGVIVDRRINEAISRLVADGDISASDDDTLTLARTVGD